MVNESCLSNIVARILNNRNIIKKEEIELFFNNSSSLLNDPFLLYNINEAVNRIKEAKNNNEKVAIYGDYDVDGVTSVSLLCLYLKDFGIDVSYYIPERIEEGYGINLSALDKIKASGVSLIITVDAGITAVEEIKYAYSIGLEVIITDHHECKEGIPSCVAVINPKHYLCNYPFKMLAGVGVAFKLICVLEGKGSCEKMLKKYCDIVAIGTVADVMPLVGENRYMVSQGLKKLNSENKLCGIKALLNIAGADETKKITAKTIGYLLAPRINAAGRIGCAMRAVELFITEDFEKADEIAILLCDENKQRQNTENDIIIEAIAKIEEEFDFYEDRVIVLANEGWHHGIIGIVASRLADKYNYPTILISKDGANGKGSGRSVKGFNLFLALEQCSDLLEKYGGHALAAGLSISFDKIDIFREKINIYAKENIDFENLKPYIEADCEITSNDLNIDAAKDLLCLEPFGMGNPEPVFLLNSLIIKEILSISNGKHIKLTLEKEGIQIFGLYFGMKFLEFDFIEGDIIDVMCNYDINCYRGHESLQLFVKDVRLKVKRDTNYLNKKENNIPSKADFKEIYHYIKNHNQNENYNFSVRSLALRNFPSKSEEKAIDSLTNCLEIFNELELIDYKFNEELVFAKILRDAGKVNLSSSAKYRSLINNSQIESEKLKVES